jgi:hypothetical protein
MTNLIPADKQRENAYWIAGVNKWHYVMPLALDWNIREYLGTIKKTNDGRFTWIKKVTKWAPLWGNYKQGTCNTLNEAMHILENSWNDENRYEN